MNSIRSKFVVFGKVQGVGFRYHTRSFAVKLRIRGYAKNLIDGSVEVLTIASKENTSQIRDWLNIGPERAVVESVVLLEEKELIEESSVEGLELFTIL
ncbi:acylphosphatase [Vibrio sp. 99-70-13A1]|uniref:acylphosphatase n=1 Tax=Vibrio sp. 99-70-13A1 TaxID=2607601 RepID=UPI001493298E|nr:acylphosphatase [Vibrio sp. 99-70-13A1]NOH96226.1 acylphosphatase [Vibrio sp. 99-70-13A1]